MAPEREYEGAVKSWKEPWGWISCEEAGADVFCHVQDVTTGVLRKDALVRFELATDQKSGKPRARHIAVIGVAEAGPESGQRHTGTIKNWKEAWGWISSPELDDDVFGHREDLVNAGPMDVVETGAAVRFDVGVDEKSGKPRAKRIELLDVAQKHTGEIMSWKDQWGWVRCEQVEGGDIFAHSDDLLTIVSVGMRVSFELGSDRSGRRRAKRIAELGGKGMGKHMMMAMPMPHGQRGGYGKGPPPMAMSHRMPPAPGRGYDRGFDHGFGPGFDHAPPHFGGPNPGYGGKGGLPGPQAFIGQQLEGRVEMWKEKWGWISCPLFGGDIFSHEEDIKGGNVPALGSRVFFTPGTDNKGRMRALQIGVAKGGGAGRAKRKADRSPPKERPGEAEFEELEGSVIEGEVLSWKSPWGWVQSPQYTGDLFAHKEDVLSGEDLVAGDQVFFMVARDHKSGRWRAREIKAAKRRRT